MNRLDEQRRIVAIWTGCRRRQCVDGVAVKERGGVGRAVAECFRQSIQRRIINNELHEKISFQSRRVGYHASSSIFHNA